MASCTHWKSPTFTAYSYYGTSRNTHDLMTLLRDPPPFGPNGTSLNIDALTSKSSRLSLPRNPQVSLTRWSSFSADQNSCLALAKVQLHFMYLAESPALEFGAAEQVHGRTSARHAYVHAAGR